MKRLYSVGAFTALLTLSRMLSGFIISKVIAIYAGPSGVAILGQFQSVLALVNGVVTSPVGSSIVRYTAENSEDNNSMGQCAPWWSAAFRWSLILSFFLFIVIVSFSKEISIFILNDSKYYWLFIIVVFLFPLSIFSVFFSSVLNGIQSYKKYVVLGMVSVLLNAIAMISFILLYRVNGALIAAALSTGISGLVMLLFAVRQKWFKISYLVARCEQRHFYAIGRYVFMAMISAMLSPLVLLFIRNQLVSNFGWYDAGLWQSVWKISEVYLSVITISLSTYFLPRLSKLDNVGKILSEVQYVVKLVLPTICLMAACIYFFKGLIIEILFTSEFLAAKDFFFYQLCGDVIKIIAFIYAYPMISRGAVSWYVSSELLFSILFCTLSYLFMRKYGVDGVCLAYFVNYTAYFIFVFFNIKRFAK